MKTAEKIRKFIESNLVVFEDEAEFTNADNIFELGFVNSLFAMKILSYVENEFSVNIENDDMEIANFSSVNNIVNMIERKTIDSH